MTMTAEPSLIGTSQTSVSAMVRLLRQLRAEQDEAARKSVPTPQPAPIVDPEPVPDQAPPTIEVVGDVSRAAQEPAPSRDVVSFAPSDQTDLAPSGLRAKAHANLAAIRTRRQLDHEQRAATDDELAVMGRYSGWGSLPKVFDEADTSLADVRAELRSLLSDDEWDKARRTVLFAHYTSAVVVKAMWEAVQDLGFSGGRVLEPGCGSGNFIGLAPDLPLDFYGVEVDPTTARICQALYPHATIRTEPFEKSKFPLGYFDAVIGNVPFSDIIPHDPTFNRGMRSLHNFCIIKSLHYTAPGGIVALLTSRYTLDSKNTGARAEMAGLADLIGAVRLPNASHRAAAGTDVIMDILLLRRRAEGDVPNETAWRNVTSVETPDGPVETNEYFATRPHLVLGTLGAKHGQYHEHDMVVKADSVLSDSLPRALRSLRVQVIDFRAPDATRPAPPIEETGPSPLGPDVVVVPTIPDDVATCIACGYASGACACFVQVPDPLPSDVPTADELFETDDTALASAPKTKRRRLAALPDPLPVAKCLSCAANRCHIHQEGSILRSRGNRFLRIVDGVTVSFAPTSAKDVPELNVLVDLRDTVLNLLDAQSKSNDDSNFLALQADLNHRYDGYVNRFGALNRFTKSNTGKVDHVCRCDNTWVLGAKDPNPTECPECEEPYEDVGTPRLKRNFPRMGGFRIDPAFYTVMALEVFDPESQTAAKADVFSKRVVAPREVKSTADSPQDALAICLDQHGRVDIDVIASLLGSDNEDAREQLGTLVWRDPDTESLVPAATYLSGNVRQKLARAKRVARLDASYESNVHALTAVQPPELGPDEIDARPGAPWIPVEDVEAFVSQVLFPGESSSRYSTLVDIEYARITATWEVSCQSWRRNSVAVTSTWGTRRADALKLLEWSLNQKPAQVFDVIDLPDGKTKRVLNVDETFAAREKQEALADRFRAWMWEDAERSERTARVYNDLFNSYVVPTFDGSHLTIPGSARGWREKVHPHQLNSVWRILQSPTALLAHPVGSGKTACIGMSAMEMRRLGLVNKPCAIIPNHMLAQVANELLQLYPLAKILVPTDKDMKVDGRKNFVARCAMGDWDLVLLTHSAFGAIGVSGETSAKFVAQKVDQFEEAISESRRDGKSLSVKKLEAAKLRLEQRQEKLLDTEDKDDGVSFEETGIDYLFVDEAQFFKNRYLVSRIQGISGKGAKRASDLDMKLSYLREKVGDRVSTFTTATPIANSISEMFVVQSYLQPQVLHDAGVENFDGWAATFGSTITALELAPDGGSYRMHSRFARFHNVPELITMFRMVADVMTPEDLNLPIPSIVGGKPETVIVPPSEELTDYVASLVERAKEVRNGGVMPEVDNMLKICTDGRKAALDLRLVNVDPDPAGGKITAAADRIFLQWERNRDRLYPGSDRPGGFQLAFCDLGTPKETRWSVYAELKRALVERGIPNERVRFIHEATNAAGKAELFAACRAGRIAVLLGSTGKMGIGTNVQHRLVAMHHLDCPWRPDEIEQRDGRGLRQGNLNSEVHIYRYATEGSFDIYLYQTVERKAAFIHQVMSGKITSREVDDIGDSALSYAEIKALATGNPLIMEKAGVDNDVARLRRLRKAHDDDQRRLKYTLDSAVKREPMLSNRLDLIKAAIAQRLDVGGEAFSMVIGDTTYDKRVDAGEALKDVVMDVIGDGATGTAREIGAFGGFIMDAIVDRRYELFRITIALRDSPVAKEWTRIEFRAAAPLGIVATLSHLVQGLDEMWLRVAAELSTVKKEGEAASERLGASFDQADRLTFLLRRQAEIDEALRELEEKAA